MSSGRLSFDLLGSYRWLVPGGVLLVILGRGISDQNKPFPEPVFRGRHAALVRSHMSG